MPYERGGEVISNVADGSVITGIRRLYGVRLVGGSANSSVSLSWGSVTIHLKTLAYTTSQFPCSRYISVGNNTVTVALSGTGVALHLVVVGPVGYTSNIVSKNLVSRTTVLLKSSKNSIGRTTVLRKSTKSVISRSTVLKPTSKNLVSRLVGYKKSTKNLVCQLTKTT